MERIAVGFNTRGSSSPRPPTRRQYDAALSVAQKHLEGMGAVIAVPVHIALIRQTSFGYIVVYRFQGDDREQTFRIDAIGGVMQDLRHSEALWM